MLELKCYLVDVGENSCEIFEKNMVIDFFDALKSKNIAKLKIFKEYIITSFKNKNSSTENNDFKVVYVNKKDKMDIGAEVVDLSSEASISPIKNTDNFDLFLMNKNHRLDIRCQVVEHEVEYRSLLYKDIYKTRKSHVKTNI